MKRLLNLILLSSSISFISFAEEQVLFIDVSDDVGFMLNRQGWWYDVNADGNIDVLSSDDDGLYLNDGNGFFQSGQLFTPLGSGYHFINYNGDQYIDLIVDGRVFINLNEGFGEAGAVPERKVVAVVDFNNDGLEDIIANGSTSEFEIIPKLFINTGTDFFLSHTIEETLFGRIRLLDYDKDGYKDFVIGNRLYKNEGGFYAARALIEHAGETFQNSMLYDFDSDGEEDIVMCSYDFDPRMETYTSHIEIFVDSEDLFELHRSYSLDGLIYLKGVSDLLPFNNSPEILITRLNDGESTTELYAPGADALDLISSIPPREFPEDFYATEADFYDYDQDGQLDILLDGRVIKNVSGSTNTPPEAPLNLQSDVEGRSYENFVTLSWDLSQDEETSQSSLQYLVSLVSYPNNDDFMINLVHSYTSASGYRIVSREPNAGYNSFIIFEDLPAGRYEWHVQAIDQGLGISSFSQTGEFEIFDVEFVDASNEVGFILDMQGKWYDVNNDGNIDVIAADDDGEVFEDGGIYLNDGFGDFQVGRISSSPVGQGYNFINFNGDRFIDIILDDPSFVQDYILINNNAEFAFSEERTDFQTLAVTDVNNDGFQDLIADVAPENSLIDAQVYLRSGVGFVPGQLIGSSLIGQIRILDINGDGYNDLLVGNSMFENNEGRYADAISIEIAGDALSSNAVADFNGDGASDILLCSHEGLDQAESFRSHVEIFTLNNGTAESFRSYIVGGRAYVKGVADLMSNGQIEVLITEVDNGESPTQLYTLDDELLPIATLPWRSDDMTQWYHHEADFYDYNRDGELDILLDGRVFRNVNSDMPNSAPSAPTNPQASVDAQSVYLSWDGATDEETPDASLEYMVSLNKVEDDPQVLIHAFNTDRGSRIVNAKPNAGTNTFLDLKDLPEGQYQWRVQAIDQGMKTSDFSAEGTFDIVMPLFADVTEEEGLEAIYPTHWYDFNNDAQMDLIGRIDGVNYIFSRDDGQFQNTMEMTTGVSIDFININNDRYVDIIADRMIYTNGITQFDATDLELPENTVAVFNINRDAFEDVITSTIVSDDEVLLHVYLNSNNSVFEQNQTIGISKGGKPRLLDYNKDGSTDFFIGNKLFSNTDGFFTNTHTLPYTGDTLESSIVGDFNADGELDVLLCSYSYDQELSVYTSVVEIFAHNDDIFEPYRSYELDGRAFILGLAELTGDDKQELVLRTELASQSATGIYTVDENLVLVEDIASASAAPDFYDYDQDGDLDFLLDGRLYQNTIDYTGTSPAAPSDLSSTVDGNNVVLRWGSSSDRETPDASLSYNVSVVSSTDVFVHPYSDEMGNRTIGKEANAGTSRFFMLDDLPLGAYTWNVQAVDQGRQASAFSAEGTFDIVMPLFADVTEEEGLEAIYPTHWYDFNNDAQMDLIGRIDGVNYIFSRDDGQFQNTMEMTTGVSIDFININNDRYVDIIADRMIYTNGITQFDATDLELPENTVAVFNINRDAFEDVITSTIVSDDEVLLHVYLNSNNSVFEQNQTIGISKGGKPRLLDYNKDGSTDFFIGNKLFSNTDGFFTNTHTLPYTGDTLESSIVGDFNADGELDVLLCSYSYDQELSVYTSVVEIFAHNDDIFEPYRSYELDGRAFILGLAELTGDDKQELVLRTELASQSATGIYTVDENLVLVEDIASASAAPDFYDYDQDGDLDFLLDGRLYQNTIDYTGTSPAAPSDLSSTVDGNNVVLRWGSSSDRETPDASLSYNVSVVSSTDVFVHPYSDEMGNRTIGKEANAGTSRFFMLDDLPLGAYTWNVQAVDQGRQASAFSAEGTFDIVMPLFADVTEEEGLEAIYPTHWYDFNNDAQMDLIGRIDGVNYIFSRDDGQFQNTMEMTTGVSIDFININNDRYVDIIADRMIYTNGITQFDATDLELPENTVAVFNINRDAFEDVITSTIVSDDEVLLHVYLNSNNSVFEQNQTIGISKGGKPRLLDYNKDGSTDFFIGNKLFSNTDGFFTNTHTLPYTGDTLESSIVGDFNADGELDVLLCSYSYDQELSVYTSVVEIFAHNDDIFEPYRSYELDGRAFILGLAELTGDDKQELVLRTELASQSATGIYTVDENLVLVEDIASASAAPDFYDYDQDGDLDFLLDGRLYQNTIDYTGTSPAAPSDLSSTVDGNNVVLRWGSSSDRETPDASLSYNVSVVSSTDVFVHPYSDEMGNRTIGKEANAGTSRFFMLDDLPLGTYTWNVQAVDQGRQASVFSVSDTIEITEGTIIPKQYLNVKHYDIVYGGIEKEFVVAIYNDVVEGIFAQTIDGGSFQKTSHYKKLLNISDVEQVKLLDDTLNARYHIIYRQSNNSFGIQSFNYGLDEQEGMVVHSESGSNTTHLLGTTIVGDYIQIYYLSMEPPLAGSSSDILLKLIYHPTKSGLPSRPISELKIGEFQLDATSTILESSFEGGISEMESEMLSVVWSLNTTIQNESVEPLSGGLRVFTLNKRDFSTSEQFVISALDGLSKYIVPKIDYNFYDKELFVGWIETKVDKDGVPPDIFEFSEVFGKQLQLGDDLSSFVAASDDIQMSKSGIQGNTNAGAVDFELFHSLARNDYFVLWENNNLNNPRSELGVVSTLNVDRYNLEVSNPVDSAFLSVSLSRPFVVYNPDDRSYLLLWYHDQDNEAVTITRYTTPKDPRIMLESISPASAYAGQKVVISGANFGKTPYLNSVIVGSFRASVDTVFFSSNKLQFEVPEDLEGEDVPIFVSFDDQGTSSEDIFAFGPKLPPQIELATVSNPATCGSVTLRGQFFKRDTIAVSFNGVPVEAEDISHTNTTIVCPIPQGVEGDVEVVVLTDERETEFQLSEQIYLGAQVRAINSDPSIGLIEGIPIPAQIRLTVYDECSVEKLELRYRGITSQGSWQLVQEGNVLKREAENYYTAEIEDFYQDPVGLEYYFNITDRSGSEVYSDTLNIYRTFLGKDSINNVSEFIDFFGSGPENYRLISAPYLFSNNQVSEVFGDLTRLHGGDIKQWRLFKYDQGFVDITASDNEVVPGDAFAIVSRSKSDSYFTKGTTISLDNDEFVLTLSPGWNLVGNPFAADVSWASIINYNGNPTEVGTPLILENGWKSTPTDFVLKKFSGIAIHNKSDQDFELKFPQKGSASGRISASDEEYLWNAMISINAGGFFANNIAFGMHRDASNGIDFFDEAQAPRFVSYMELNSLNLSHEGVYSQDIVAANSNYRWAFKLEENVGDGLFTMSWAMHGVNRGLWLFDDSNNKLIDMHHSDTYSFANSSGFQFIYGDRDFLSSELKPTFTSIGRLYPNPVDSRLTIEMFVNEGQVGEGASIKLCDLSGKTWTNLTTNLQSNYQWLDIDLSSVPKGFYVLLLQIEGSTFSRKIVKN
jgi:predicted secreted protein